MVTASLDNNKESNMPDTTRIRSSLTPRLLVCLSVLGLAVAVAESVGAQQQTPVYELKVATDRPDAMYKQGENVKFQVTLLKDKQEVHQGDVSYRLDKDTMNPQLGKLSLSQEPTVISSKLDEPGFLRCVVTYKVDAETTLTTVAAAAIDPLQIKPSLPVPDDFDEFWDEQKQKLAAIPINPRLTPVAAPGKDASIECFDVQLDCVGDMPVSGYFARPAKAAPKSLPAILSVHGAGVRSSVLGSAVGGAKLPALSMDINAHGIPNGQPDDFYAELTGGKLKDYRYAGRASRDTCYFLGMYLRLIRAIDFLCSQPEWDGKVLIVRGTSQGGGQSIVAAGLDPRVTAFAAGVPAMCDHSGKVVNRVNGWPKLVATGPDGKPDARILSSSRYFDAMNFATRTKAQAIVSVGFIDSVCPPTSVYAMYNNLPGKKEIINEPHMGHGGTPRVAEAFNKMIAEHIQRMTSK
jgi:cephalosporin-C deacetylase-like acetyl esterase